MGIFHGGRGMGRAVSGLLVLVLLAGGCSERVTTYQVPGPTVASGQKILILPFMDTRTFVDSDDPHKDDVGTRARDIFADAVRANASVQGVDVATPELPAQTRSLTNAEVAEIGREHGAQVVVAGQIFSFTGTRAASIPARAGMFVRVVSARDGALLFVGDHYQAAAVPGAGGGRELQARNVSNRLVEGILSQAKSLADATVKAASASALASLAVPAGRGRRAVANNAGDKAPEPPPLIGLGGSGFVDPSQWDDQIVPAVPPVIDYNDDLYQTPLPPPVPEPPKAEPAPAKKPEPKEAEVVEAASENKKPAAPKPEFPNLADLDIDRALAGEAAAAPTKAEVKAEAKVEDVAKVPAPTVPAVPAASGTDNGEAAAKAEPAESAGENEPAETAEAAAEKEPLLAEGASLEELYAKVEAEIADASYAAGLTGDQLMADLFASGGELPDMPDEPKADAPELAVLRRGSAGTGARESQVAAASTGPIQAPAEPAKPEAVETQAADRVVVDIVTGTMAKPTPVEQAAMVYDIDLTAIPAAMDPVEPVRPVAAMRKPAPVDEPERPAERMVFRDNGPVVSIPLAVEQPRPARFVDMVAFPADPETATVTFDPEVKAPAPALAMKSKSAIRVLVLPYHDRENANNLIDHTGGGEVVTTLYGARLALDPEVQVLWDATGQATHDRLVDSEEALQLGRMVDADFVVRGQVVEFRRAQSVPSFYSAMISTAVLAAQMFFAEMSGVDVATEVYRVSDGRCVMSRRDRAQQKYVVQAEKTVRRLAAGMADGVVRAVKADDPDSMDPLIDTLEPLTVFTNPKR